MPGMRIHRGSGFATCLLYTSRLEAARQDGRGYFVVKKKAAWEEAQRLRGMDFDWIQIDSGSERHYPNGPLAAHILGGVCLLYTSPGQPAAPYTFQDP